MASMKALEKAEALVNQLIETRDNYEVPKTVDDVEERSKTLEQQLKSVLVELDQLQLSIDKKAAFFYLRGKALNSMSSQFDSRAVECLSKAVKLDPNLIEAWNELGECYWKNRDIETAYNCFKSAISKCENKVSLRNLSMVERQLPADFHSKVDNIRQSVDMAKKAVAMDVKDGHSWFILGNAYLSLFFFAGQSIKVLKQCMVAYTKAEQDPKEVRNPDLYYNRAVAFSYQEDFQQALEGFQKSSQLDPSWDQPQNTRNDLINRLKLSADMVLNKGRLKPKKITAFKNQIKDSDYGPFASGTYVSPLNKTISLKRTDVKDLNVERNSNAVICGKVVAVIPVQEDVPFPFVLMDQLGDCIAVSVFNLTVGKGMIIGDSVTIPEPYVENIDITIEGQNVTFRSVRVDNPIVLVVNKRKVGPERLAFSVLSVTNKSD